MGIGQKQARRILIASANPLFAKGLRKLFAGRESDPVPEMRLAGSMEETVRALEDWLPDLVIVDYDDRTINRSEFLNHFVASDAPMQVMLVSLQASGEVVVYDRRNLTPDQAQDWLNRSEPEELPQYNSEIENTPAKAAVQQSFFTFKWLLLTALVLVVLAAFIRLGFWQLDRLAQRRAYNARVQAQMNLPPLDLNHNLPNPQQLTQSEYRNAVVSGQYDLNQEVVLSNQVWNEDELGVHVLTPLKIQGTDYAVLVDRGWIPMTDADAAQRAKYAVAGTVIVHGMLRLSQARAPIFGIQPAIAPGRQDAWNQVDLAAIQKQTSLKLLPVFLQSAPDPGRADLPRAALPSISLTEGPHLGYAIQWFLFALTLAILYPVFVRNQFRSRRARVSSRARIEGAGTAHHNHA